MATTVFRKVSYEEFQELPRDGSKRFELIEGEVFMTPSPNTKHQRAVGRLFRALSDFVEVRTGATRSRQSSRETTRSSQRSCRDSH
jgi:Uma2 family endonuclease